MKQHLAKSLLMAGAMIASYPLFAQQAQPIQPTQPMQSTQPMQATKQGQAQPMQAIPTAAPANPSLARSPDPAMDPASMSLAPDALGTRIGQRNPFLDGA
ncbi:hypothetical protein [Cupriavidus basilensis]|uniref:hypothetical protein n=1 Tax=Cupriavidus basilensis TaxID=68895 RepID=UPI0023E8A176|nr:hypothetical protein [Cupriavidus basilensis]MDF3883148.1 hypothetical protein [Cupriavidus basilensis]